MDDGTKTWTVGFKGKNEICVAERLQFFNRKTIKHAKDRLIPDGLMTEPLRGESTNIAIEVELTIKSSARYKRIFNEYRDGGSPKNLCVRVFELGGVSLLTYFFFLLQILSETSFPVLIVD
nr:hypothetical protein HAGR004_05920 [Bdellovibrio sp. HAGR004]